MHAVCSTSPARHLPPLRLIPVLSCDLLPLLLPTDHQRDGNIQIITLVPCIRLIAVSLLGISHVLLVAGGFLEAAAASSAIHGQCPALASPPHDQPDELDKPTCLISRDLFEFFCFFL